ncbi:hypothetical protein [Candidatus Synechococcus spongiarum]|nr:hypothetical protein [Candidatus Synechococcus spongiarum]
MTTTPLQENRQVLAKPLGLESVSTPQLVTASAHSWAHRPA